MKRLARSLGVLAIIGFASWSNAARRVPEVVPEFFQPSRDRLECVAKTLGKLKIPVDPKNLGPVLDAVSGNSNLHILAPRKGALKDVLFIHGPALTDYYRAQVVGSTEDPSYQITWVNESGDVETHNARHVDKTAHAGDTGMDIALDVASTIEKRVQAGRFGKRNLQEKITDAMNYHQLMQLREMVDGGEQLFP